MKELEPNWRGLRPVVPVFDMSFVHKIVIPDIRPRTPKRPPGVSDQYFARLCDYGYTRSISARAEGEKLRSLLLHFIDRGNLEIVSDPHGFMDDGFEPIDPAERSILDEQKAKEAAAVADLDFSASGNSRSNKVAK